MVDVDGVDVEVVDAGVVVLPGIDVGLLQANVVDATPFEEDLAALDVYLLDDALPRSAILGAADGGEVPGHGVVDRYQGGVLRADEELVVVPVVSVARTQPGDLAVGGVEDHVLARRFAPGKHGPTSVGLDSEAHRASVGPAKGRNHTTSPRSSKIIEPPCPAPPSSGATKTWPGAASCALVTTSTAGGLRSGRERKAHVPPTGADEASCKRWTFGKREGLTVGVRKDLSFRMRSSGAQPTVLDRAR